MQQPHLNSTSSQLGQECWGKAKIVCHFKDFENFKRIIGTSTKDLSIKDIFVWQHHLTNTRKMELT